MGGTLRRARWYSGAAASAFILFIGASGTANAQAASEAQVKALQAQVEALMRTVKELKEAQSHTAADVKAAKKQAKQAEADSALAKATAADAHKRAKQPVKTGWLDKDGHYFLERKPGKSLTFYTPGGEITGYGQFDVSIDAATKDARGTPGRSGRQHAGRQFRLDARHLDQHLISGRARLPAHPHAILQLRLSVRSRHRHFGGARHQAVEQQLQQPGQRRAIQPQQLHRTCLKGWGAIKIGKTDAPYKNSTAMFNPFSGMWGDYAVIMGNSGGDNRVEFGTRINHAIWYESPTFGGGFKFNVLFSPGQNRADDSSNLASGESDCSGNNDPEQRRQSAGIVQRRSVQQRGRAPI